MNNTVRSLDSIKWDDNSHPIVQTTQCFFKYIAFLTKRCHNITHSCRLGRAQAKPNAAYNKKPKEHTIAEKEHPNRYLATNHTPLSI